MSNNNIQSDIKFGEALKGVLGLNNKQTLQLNQVFQTYLLENHSSPSEEEAQQYLLANLDAVLTNEQLLNLTALFEEQNRQERARSIGRAKIVKNQLKENYAYLQLTDQQIDQLYELRCTPKSTVDKSEKRNTDLQKQRDQEMKKVLTKKQLAKFKKQEKASLKAFELKRRKAEIEDVKSRYAFLKLNSKQAAEIFKLEQFLEQRQSNGKFLNQAAKKARLSIGLRLILKDQQQQLFEEHYGTTAEA